LGVVAVVAAVIVGGCTEGEDGAGGDAPSSSDPGQQEPSDRETPSRETSAQRTAAEAYHACLVEAGLPAQIDPVDDGDAAGDAFVTFGDHHVLQSIPGLSDTVSEGNTVEDPISDEDQLAFFESHKDPDTFGLLVDGVDYSADFERCFTESSYSEPDFRLNPAEQERQIQGVLDATNTWIACARENGYPDLADIPDSSGDTDFYPTAELPATIDEPALRALLEACPTFDEDAQREAYDAVTRGESVEFPAMPSVGIAMPDDPDATLSTDSPALAEWQALSQILWEKQMAFYDSLEGE
jgi:hypothetical protein